MQRRPHTPRNSLWLNFDPMTWDRLAAVSKLRKETLERAAYTAILSWLDEQPIEPPTAKAETWEIEMNLDFSSTFAKLAQSRSDA